MPQKENVKINGSKIKSRLYSGFQKAAPPVAAASIAIGLVAVACSPLIVMVVGKRQDKAINDYREYHASGASYTLTDAHQIRTYDGDIQYDINFRSRMVAVDGPDEADDVRFFTEFNGSSFIEDARQAGLEAARKIVEQSASTDSSLGGYSEYDDFKDLVSDAEVFLEYYEEMDLTDDKSVNTHDNNTDHSDGQADVLNHRDSESNDTGTEPSKTVSEPKLTL